MSNPASSLTTEDTKVKKYKTIPPDDDDDREFYVLQHEGGFVRVMDNCTQTFLPKIPGAKGMKRTPTPSEGPWDPRLDRLSFE